MFTSPTIVPIRPTAGVVRARKRNTSSADFTCARRAYDSVTTVSRASVPPPGCSSSGPTSRSSGSPASASTFEASTLRPCFSSRPKR